MKEYYFLFGLFFLWTLFASIQDLRKREVANWLNFSLIAFALAYRLFYSILTENYYFFAYGAMGFAIFFVLAYVFYYVGVFAGGDAKLLMGFGFLLPYQNYFSLFSLSLVFIFLLFSVGSVYSIVYSFFIAGRNRRRFKKGFFSMIKRYKLYFFSSIILFLISAIYSFFNLQSIFFVLLFLIFPLYIYTKSLEKCMIILVSPSQLTEGDWIERDIKVGGRVVKKTIHGLTLGDIKLLRKYNKKVFVKQGVPFVPAFLITLIMVFAFLVLGYWPDFAVFYLF